MGIFRRRKKDILAPEPVARPLDTGPMNLSTAAKEARNLSRLSACVQNMERLKEAGKEDSERYRDFEQEYRRRSFAQEEFNRKRGGKI